ncbi:MAG: CBS domain-containing protein [Bdellovibrionales bacterium]|nr:CBS domain-containing protein [Massilia sp.]
MNDQPLHTIEPYQSAFGDGAAQPLPTIEPELVEMAAALENPVRDDPLPSAAAELATIEFAPVAKAGAAGVSDSMAVTPALEAAVDAGLNSQASRPISAVMDQTLWTVHAEDSIERVIDILAQQNLSSAPVVGSNGAIVGMIGVPELSQFHADGKNAKAVQAWEIARIKAFEVSPDHTVEEVAKVMAENKIESISVTEFGRLRGIVSTQTLLQDMLKVLPDQGGR